MRIVVGMSPRTGRPPSEDPRSVVLSLRLTTAESEALREAADRAGQPVTVFVRERALAAAKRTR
jgi:uncharacterized protein (DUF1778 family)